MGQAIHQCCECGGEYLCFVACFGTSLLRCVDKMDTECVGFRVLGAGSHGECKT